MVLLTTDASLRSKKETDIFDLFAVFSKPKANSTMSFIVSFGRISYIAGLLTAPVISAN